MPADAGRRLIVSADDFGIDPAVNEAVEEAHRHGILSTASLMVAAPAAADAVARARSLPRLRVGLHLVLVDGSPALPVAEIPDLVDRNGEFGRDMARLGLRIFLFRHVREQLAREIRAQFEAFRATGLALDHVNAHKHLHIHPNVAALIVEIGREYGLKAVRVPAEPSAVLRRACPGERAPIPLHAPWIMALRRRLRRAGLAVNDHVFGIAWSGRMIEDRVLRLVPYLPDGVSEIYFHPAARHSALLDRAAPGYRRCEEFATLVSPKVRECLAEHAIRLIGWSDLAPAGADPR